LLRPPADDTREIIDESDVFVDVGRAIRRMAPAPKARVPKGKIVTNTETSEASAPENLLIDITENETLSPAQLQRARTGTTDLDAQSPRVPQSYLMHRRSSAAGSDKGDVQKRLNTPDMREHLKHLGPANAASKPKATRMKTITMKPGRSMSQSDEPNSGTTPSRRVSEPLAFSSPPGKAAEAMDSLVGSAGKYAKDGVQALKSVYGSMDKTPTKSSISNKAIPAGQEEDLPEPDATPTKMTQSAENNDEENKRTPRSPAPAPATSVSVSQPNLNASTSKSSVHSSSSISTVPSLPDRRARSGSPNLSRGPARSGSITEHIIDSHGIKKVVLETTSSSSSDEAAKRTNGMGSDGVGDSKDRRKEDSEDTGSKGLMGAAKKKRRRKKGRGGKAGERGTSEESRPLLS
jgi:metal transporter CNNM